MSRGAAPAPWTFTDTDTRGWRACRIHDAAGCYIASVIAYSDDRGPADAMLMAAAPELLELARQYVSECGECAGVGITIDDEPCENCANIRAVIAKATLP